MRLVALAGLAVVAGCGEGAAEAPVRPLVDQVVPAMAAVEAELGGPQAYFEVNATPQLVRVFVAIEGATKVAPYVYVGGELEMTAAAANANGPTFAAADVTFDPATILDGVTDELADSDVVVFSVAADPSGAAEYHAGVQSDEGGTLDVMLAADGAVLSVDPGG